MKQASVTCGIINMWLDFDKAEGTEKLFGKKKSWKISKLDKN